VKGRVEEERDIDQGGGGFGLLRVKERVFEPLS